jgi:hypothetical protein
MDYEQTSLVYRNLGHEKKFQESMMETSILISTTTQIEKMIEKGVIPTPYLLTPAKRETLLVWRINRYSVV